MSNDKIKVKINIAGTHDGPSDEARCGAIRIDEESGEVLWDVYIPESSDGDLAKVDLDAIESVVPAEG